MEKRRHIPMRPALMRENRPLQLLNKKRPKISRLKTRSKNRNRRRLRLRSQRPRSLRSHPSTCPSS
jgi:hypothetical protein